MSEIVPYIRYDKRDRMILLRSVYPDDAVSLINLTHRILQQPGIMVTAPDEFDVTEDQERKWITEHLDQEGWVAIAAESEKNIIGFIDMNTGTRRSLSHRGILGICIHPDWQNAGIGPLLMDALFSWAATVPSIEKITLAVISENDRAIHLYQKYGFIMEGHRHKEIKRSDGTYQDDILMARFLR